MKEHLALLGLRAKDVVTGFEGVVTSVSFDLYGCVQAVISPGLDKDGKIAEGHWFDVARIQRLSVTTVMPAPDFDTPREVAIATASKGPAAKPLPRV